MSIRTYPRSGSRNSSWPRVVLQRAPRPLWRGRCR